MKYKMDGQGKEPHRRPDARGRQYAECRQHAGNLHSARTRLSLSARLSTQAGLTLIELLTVVLIVGILASIIAPSWLGVQSANALNVGQDNIFQALRQAQQQSIQSRQSWQARFRELNHQVQWSTDASAALGNGGWQDLPPNVRIALDQTTLRQQDKGIYFVEFNYKGNVTPPFGRLSLASARGGQQRRCVFVSTLLGVLRKDSDQACYR